jgi:glutamate synthase domain-containing protein 2
MTALIVVGVIVGVLSVVVVYDLVQKPHAILRNFPIVGHFRYWLEAVGPELRQYIVTGNNEERPFSRDQRRWVYASSKKENNYFGFGTDRELELSPNYLIIKQSTFPHSGHPHPEGSLYPLPAAKILGGPRGRAKAFRPGSIVNLSAMSYGSLSGAAVQAINMGCRLADCLHNTGEGGIAPHHDQGGGLIWQLGTGYFGARDSQGNLDLERLVDNAARHRVRAIEIKLSQGAKPGKGGVLPAAKVSAEIAAIRGIPVGQSCLSPSSHTAFSNADELLDVVEAIAERTGLPVGIKSAIGQLDFWEDLACLMESGTRGVDYIQIDGGEGGTGAAPLVFSDHVSLPFKLAMARVFPLFAARGLDQRLVWIGSGRLGFPAETLTAMALGCDMVAVAREAMLAIGCIQAQRCHTGHCPAGVATQSRWLARGLDPTLKGARLANYMATLRHDVLDLTHACGQAHPAGVTLDHLEIVDDRFGSRPAREVFGYQPGWGQPSDPDLAAIFEVMAAGPPEPAALQA